MRREIDLSRFRSPATIGTEGDVVVTGDGVLPRHAVLRIERDDAGEPGVSIEPLRGRVTVERRGRPVVLLGPWVLADGDVILLGARRLTYRRLGSLAERAQARRNVAWIR